jgi:hypothetical protein
VPVGDQLTECHAFPTQFRQALGALVAKRIRIIICVIRDTGAIPAASTWTKRLRRGIGGVVWVEWEAEHRKTVV